ncbi:unnamed protein product [Vitrella brassicaformis CCMP3155]|uniref:Uncharacterized protein n=1 Tax=Vitrella brassicaformis (strain CCMP3155) TaxID=1169540 RepID=A0A0G4GSF4_VITBC|nr:unnamed protein product [Vitrella brassicaformis CCMP3155]|mmetsp:Transcript_27277/g.78434  ORF Transcript_27277/g.78434 Transcript_27277/m.78434 type:complete len:335 (+) Transcript_27277:114-1118(+)|eukprot:CEM33539.1 unnamed protein product [Vitrella brassicaformis CCMP3155]
MSPAPPKGWPECVGGNPDSPSFCLSCSGLITFFIGFGVLTIYPLIASKWRIGGGTASPTYVHTEVEQNMGLKFYTLWVELPHYCHHNQTDCLITGDVRCHQGKVKAPLFGELAFEKCGREESYRTTLPHAVWCRCWPSYGFLRDKAAERGDKRMEKMWNDAKWSGIAISCAAGMAFVLAAAALVFHCSKPTNVWLSALSVLQLTAGVVAMMVVWFSVWRNGTRSLRCFGDDDMHGGGCQLHHVWNFSIFVFCVLAVGVVCSWAGTGALVYERHEAAKRSRAVGQQQPPAVTVTVASTQPQPNPQPPAVAVVAALPAPLPAIVGNAIRDSTGGDW